MKVLERRKMPAPDPRGLTFGIILAKVPGHQSGPTFKAPWIHADFQSFLRLFPLQLPSSNVEISSSPSSLGSLANV